MTPIELVQHACRLVTDVPVVSKVPMERPPLFVRVDQAAPRVLSPVHQRCRVMVQVYGQDLEEVLELSDQLRRQLEDFDMCHDRAFGSEEIDGPVDFQDPDSPEIQRWQITALIYMATS